MAPESRQKSGPVLPSQVVVGLHFHESGACSFEFEREPGAAVQPFQGAISRDYKLHPPVIELIDEVDKAPCLIVVVIIQAGYSAENQGMVQLGNLYIVEGAAGAVAERSEAEPHHIIG